MYGVATDDNGLYYMRARYYNVSIKRFINQDIVTGSITNSQSLNKFSYVQGNPISLTDPFGLSPNISLSGIGHAALNLLGIIPGLDICDAVNVAWYMAEGDYANATMCMVAVLPMLGSIAGNGIKWGMKAGTGAEKVADTVKLGSRLAGNGGAFILSGGQAVESVKNIHANYVETGEVFSWNNAGDFLTLGLSVAGMGTAGASVAKSGATLKSVWKDEITAVSAAVSNATKKVVSSCKNTFRERILHDNCGMVDLDAFRIGNSSTKKITGTSYDITKLVKTQSYVERSNVAGMKESIIKDGANAVPPISVRVHQGEALVVQGHHRLEAFRQLGYERVPIKYVHKSQLGKIQKDGDYFRTIEELLAGRVYN